MKNDLYIIFGGNGQLGREFSAELTAENIAFISVDRDESDLTQYDLIDGFISRKIGLLNRIGKVIIVNCAAYTDVEKAESDKDICHLVNVTGAKNAALLAKKYDADLFYYSTDFVFDGKKGAGYTENDQTSPLSCYGVTKLEGEEISLSTWHRTRILRVAWLYGQFGNNFVRKIAIQAKDKGVLKVVDDQFGSPTWTKDVVKQTLALVDLPHYGVFHSVNKGCVSRRDMSILALDQLGIPCQITGCKTNEFIMKAARPLRADLINSRLNSLGANVMCPWDVALRKYCAELKKIGLN